MNRSERWFNAIMPWVIIFTAIIAVVGICVLLVKAIRANEITKEINAAMSIKQSFVLIEQGQFALGARSKYNYSVYSNTITHKSYVVSPHIHIFPFVSETSIPLE